MKRKQTFPKLVDFKQRNQDIGRFFGSMPPLALFALIIVFYAAITGIGYWIGHQRFLEGFQDPHSPVETGVASILGLLAFMLAFTFSLTWSRFAQRNNLVISQAKALLCCYLRTSLLPEKQKLEIRALFHEYVNALIRLQMTLDVEKPLARITELHLLLWRQTTSLVDEEMDSELRALFTCSVDELIRLVVERKTIGVTFRIPDAIWSSLLLLAVMGMATFGYHSGISGSTRLFQLFWLPIAFGLVIVLIADLNASGTQRKFKVTYRPLKDVLDLMKKDIP